MPEHQGRPRLRILVVDDNQDGVLTLTSLLEAEGYETRALYSALEVGDAVRDFSPDAVLLDIGMPGMSGYEVARALRERYGGATPLLIAVTAWQASSDKILARLAGFDHHVGKPYDVQELLALLRRDSLSS